MKLFGIWFTRAHHIYCSAAVSTSAQSSNGTQKWCPRQLPHTWVPPWGLKWLTQIFIHSLKKSFTPSASLLCFWVVLWLKDRSGSSRFDFSLSYRFVYNLRRSHSASILWVPIYKAVIVIIMLLSFIRVVGDLNFLIFVTCKVLYFTDGWSQRTKGEGRGFYSAEEKVTLSFLISVLRLHKISADLTQPVLLRDAVLLHGIVGGLTLLWGNAVMKRNVQEVGGSAYQAELYSIKVVCCVIIKAVTLNLRRILFLSFINWRN